MGSSKNRCGSAAAMIIAVDDLTTSLSALPRAFFLGPVVFKTAKRGKRPAAEGIPDAVKFIFVAEHGEWVTWDEVSVR